MNSWIKYCIEAIRNYGVYKNKLMFISGYTRNSSDPKMKRIYEVIIYKDEDLK